MTWLSASQRLLDEPKWFAGVGAICYSERLRNQSPAIKASPDFFYINQWTCEGTLKMASATDGLQYVKWVVPHFFSVGVAKLHAPKKVLNQKGLFDFASVERSSQAAFEGTIP